MSKRSNLLLMILGCLTVMGAGGSCGVDRPVSWQVLEPGLDIARFDSRSRTLAATGDLTVLRVDARRWNLRVLATGNAGDDQGRTLESWCRKFRLVAAINAGMYQQDGLTHVGYCKVDGRVINAGINKYQSAVAMDPLTGDDPPFRIFDLDETDLKQVTAAYRTVVQNLRLIKRPADARWPQGDASWPEAALGEDKEGRALLIYCTRPLSMHAFNQLILDLPLDLVCAQHLEGNFPARLWVCHPGWENPIGSQLTPGPSLPVVIGVEALTDTVSARAPHDR